MRTVETASLEGNWRVERVSGFLLPVGMTKRIENGLGWTLVPAFPWRPSAWPERPSSTVAGRFGTSLSQTQASGVVAGSSLAASSAAFDSFRSSRRPEPDNPWASVAVRQWVRRRLRPWPRPRRPQKPAGVLPTSFGLLRPLPCLALVVVAPRSRDPWQPRALSLGHPGGHPDPFTRHGKRLSPRPVSKKSGRG